MPPHHLAPGDTLGPYALEERLGRGGFGEVWKARHRHLQDRVVAAKIPTEAGTVELLRQEGLIHDHLHHPSIVEVLDLDLDHDPPYLLMEYIEGEDLRRRLDRDGPLPLEDALRISLGILDGLRAAHGAGAHHLDLKPANVLLPARGGIKLADFGLGKVVEATRSTLLRSDTLESVGAIAGTLAYMSPEQRTGKGPIDERADIFAFGVIFFEMITGELPAGATVPSDILPGLDPTLDDVYRACCAPLVMRYRRVSGTLLADLESYSITRKLAPPVPAPYIEEPPAAVGQVCATCGREHEGESLFCDCCGSRLEAVGPTGRASSKICPRCHKSLQDVIKRFTRNEAVLLWILLLVGALLTNVLVSLLAGALIFALRRPRRHLCCLRCGWERRTMQAPDSPPIMDRYPV